MIETSRKTGRAKHINTPFFPRRADPNGSWVGLGPFCLNGASNRHPPYHHHVRWPTVREGGSSASFQGALEGQNALDPQRRKENGSCPLLSPRTTTTRNSPMKRSRGDFRHAMGQRGYWWLFRCNGAESRAPCVLKAHMEGGRHTEGKGNGA
ncbi:hypothetical protein CXB51_015692 [Gossypium anomalum]|uniref:Uncharacterized protein n=1 Tax=Gossypium anomalum TaxID=47600 RepID=A0A8J5Z5P4_9ROSI|nr:hypothetical protein CXB51_015692 [Gossypium anomalum]